MTPTELIVLRNLLHRAVGKCNDADCDEPHTHRAGFVEDTCDSGIYGEQLLCAKHAAAWTARGGCRGVVHNSWRGDAIDAAMALLGASHKAVAEPASPRVVDDQAARLAARVALLEDAVRQMDATLEKILATGRR